MIEGPVMYSTQHQAQPPMDNMVGNVIDGSGTINPAALNQSGVLATPTSISNTSPRGIKRSRSPEAFAGAETGAYEDDNNNGDSRPKKRGRPPKQERGPDDLVLQHPGHNTQPTTGTQLPTPVSAQPGSAHSQSHSHAQQLQQASQAQQQQSAPPPKQSSPTKPASGKPVVKALPTVRDHTLDQLGPESDEYIYRETDEAGENKVAPNGRLHGTREYKCRTFLVPNRGDKLFMLATECARVLGYRDSYLLFNKNRSLYKIIATQAEKDDLIHQDILPYSYRSRQIAIVTAKSMFRQFGSRVVVNGRRVRDDYWEAKARKQGFTEEDLAGEKRPGAAKREAQASEAAAHAAAGHAPGNISYIDVPGGPHLGSSHMVPGYGSAQFSIPMENRLPMIDPSYQSRDYNDIPRPRQEIAGPAYQDRTQPSPMNEIMNHAGHASDFSKTLNSQRTQRSGLLNDYWKRDHPASSPQDTTAPPATSLSSPHLSMTGANQPMLSQGSQQYASHAAPGQSSPQQLRSQPPPPPQRSSTMSGTYGQSVPQSPGGNYSYNYPSMQHAQQSPMSSQHSLPGYGAPQTPGHPPQAQSPHPSQSPQHMGSGAGGHAGQPGMPPPQPMYAGIPPMTGMHQGYGGNMARPMYAAQPSPQTYMPNNSHTAQGAMNSGWQGTQQNWQPQY